MASSRLLNNMNVDKFLAVKKKVRDDGSIDMVGYWHSDIVTSTGSTLYAELKVNNDYSMTNTLYATSEGRANRDELYALNNEIIVGYGNWVNPKLFKWSWAAPTGTTGYIYKPGVVPPGGDTPFFSLQAFTGEFMVRDNNNLYQFATYYGCNPDEVAAIGFNKPFPDNTCVWLNREEWTRFMD